MKKVTKAAVERARAAMKRVQGRNALTNKAAYSRPQRLLSAEELDALVTKNPEEREAKGSVWERVRGPEVRDVRPPDAAKLLRLSGV
jgi:hypothetical protein